MHDLVVAGGGPVGLAAALHARRAGLDVVVVEPRAGVVDKACGEGLMPGALARLADLGVEVEGIDLAGIRYRDEQRSVDARFRAGPGRGVRRTTLHAGLSRRLAESGVEVRHEAVRSVVDHGSHLLVDGRPTRYLLAADGLHSPVRRLLGLDAPVRGARRYGQRCHLRVAPWSDFVEVHWAPHAEAYVTPVAPDLVGLAVLSGRREPYAALLDGFTGLRERVAGVERTRVMGAGPLRQQARHRVAGAVLLVGDAARATSTRSPARASRSGWPRPPPPSRPWSPTTRGLRRHLAPPAAPPRAAHPRPGHRHPAPGGAPAPGRRGRPGAVGLRRGRQPAGEAGMSRSAAEPAPEQVVLLDEAGHAVGVADKAGVHHADTPLHLVFVGYVFDHDGRILRSRRAPSKRNFPGLWTNSACGHPAPGEAFLDGVRRRVHEELGLELDDLRVLLPGFG